MKIVSNNGKLGVGWGEVANTSASDPVTSGKHGSMVKMLVSALLSELIYFSGYPLGVVLASQGGPDWADIWRTGL